MKLNIFDFDDTLFRIPTFSCAPAKFNTQNVNDWYDDPESLDNSKYRIQQILNVCDIARRIEASQPSDNYTVLITKRAPKLAFEIMNQLRICEIVMDKYFVIGHDRTKSDTLADILAKDLKDKTVTEINIYEDSLVQILDYKALLAKLHYPVQIKSNFIFVDKSHLIRIDDISAIIGEKIKLSF